MLARFSLSILFGSPNKLCMFSVLASRNDIPVYSLRLQCPRMFRASSQQSRNSSIVDANPFVLTGRATFRVVGKPETILKVTN